MSYTRHISQRTPIGQALSDALAVILLLAVQPLRVLRERLTFRPDNLQQAAADPRYFDLKAQRLALWSHNPHCGYCGTELTERQATLDHLVPISRGGQHEARNLVLSCCRCNQAKSHDTPSEWHDRLLNESKHLRRLAKAAGRIAKLSKGIPVGPFVPAEGTQRKPAPPPVDRDVWHPRDFRRGRYRYSITERSTGRVLVRNLSLSKAVHVYREIAAGDIEMTVSAVMYTDVLGMVPSEGTRSIPMAP